MVKHECWELILRTVCVGSMAIACRGRRRLFANLGGNQQPTCFLSSFVSPMALGGSTHSVFFLNTCLHTFLFST